MNNKIVGQKKQRLDNLFKAIKAESWEEEIQSHWAKYLCVLVSGFIETSIRVLLSEYARKRSAKEVANYVESNLENFRNPNMERICILVGNFNPEWRQNLENTIDEEVRGAINSIVANRNRIAHGEWVGVTLITIEDYYKRSLRMIDLIESLPNYPT